MTTPTACPACQHLPSMRKFVVGTFTCQCQCQCRCHDCADALVAAVREWALTPSPHVALTGYVDCATFKLLNDLEAVLATHPLPTASNEKEQP
jgi:hypothetical protein